MSVFPTRKFDNSLEKVSLGKLNLPPQAWQGRPLRYQRTKSLMKMMNKGQHPPHMFLSPSVPMIWSLFLLQSKKTWTPGFETVVLLTIVIAISLTSIPIMNCSSHSKVIGCAIKIHEKGNVCAEPKTDQTLVSQFPFLCQKLAKQSMWICKHWNTYWDTFKKTKNEKSAFETE